MSSEFVKVIVRCRPLNGRELENDVEVVVDMEDEKDQQIIVRHASDVNYPRKVFTFDRVYDARTTNEEIYADVVSPLVESVLDGYNGCIFAYGQTSCGKTFSMQGIDQVGSQRGIMSRTFEQIFEYIQTTDVNYCVIRTSYLEIYNEEIRDLLNKHNRHKLVVKEHPEKGVYVKDLTTVDVTCIEDMEEVLEVGSWNRVFGATAQNADSSRSHCIFTIEYEICFTSQTDGKENFRSGRINLVDLAGSERQRYSRTHGKRFKEATKINLSLSALGNVISALVNEKSKHVPYRASKLTRLLQDSLGGNSRTLMIACISPGDNNENETLSTLRYANRAKNIKNRPRINEDPKEALIRQYQKEIKTLRQMLAAQMKVTSSVTTSVVVVTSENEENSEGGQSTKLVSPRSPVLLSKQERLTYEQKLTGLQQKYELEHLSRGRLEKTLKTVQSEYDNYRLSNEYKIQKLQTHYKSKVKCFQNNTNTTSTKTIPNESSQTITVKDDSDESAYISATSDTNYDDSSSGESSTDRANKSTLLSPLTENAHLWSYQWLKCYCDTNKRAIYRGLYHPNNDYEADFHCICIEQVKENRECEKASQTCQICSKRALYSMASSYVTSSSSSNILETMITSEPKTSNDGGRILRRNSAEREKSNWDGLCCLLPFISFFGEEVTTTME